MPQATRPHQPFLYDGRDSQLTRTDLWAWSDALRRIDSAPRVEGTTVMGPPPLQGNVDGGRAWRRRLPLALIVCGPQASGKSELARALARQSGMPIVAADETRKALSEVDFAAARLRRAPAPNATDSAYRLLGQEAAELLRSDGGVIVDATFGQRHQREAFARGFGVEHPTIFCECRAPADVLQRRARARLADPRDAGEPAASIAVRLEERFEALEADIAAENHIVLRSDRPTAGLLADLVAMLDGRLACATVAGAA